MPAACPSIGPYLGETPGLFVPVASAIAPTRHAFSDGRASTTSKPGLDHFISKRTSLYARIGYFKNNGTATVSWPGVSVTEAATNQFMTAIGMTHRF